MPAASALPERLPASLVARYRWHALRRDLSNYAVLRQRRCDGYLASLHQGGTHWLKYMLASALCARHGLEPPRYNHANDVIGGPHDPPAPPPLPLLISSHSIPNFMVRSRLLAPSLRLPPCVVLVRDVRAALVSNYVKWQARYAVDFATFLAGDPAGRRFNSDLWWCLRFLNAWGTVAEHRSGPVLVVRYEDLRADPERGLARVAAHLGLDLGAGHIATGVGAATKAAMQARHDPQRPPGEVREDPEPPERWFGAAEERFLRAACRRLLHHRFGYPYER